MPSHSFEIDEIITELDAAVESHMDWVRRMLRCAVLRTTPGEDVLQPEAHALCRFGRWFRSKKAQFDKLDAQDTCKLEAVHQAMHGAARSICLDLLDGRLGRTDDLEAFERTQSELIRLLAEFKTQFLWNALRRDPLTGLPLRTGMEDEFVRSKKSCKRHGLLFYIAMLDVDHFKKINDLHGHLVGDIVLRHLADTLKASVRNNEPLYRFGGEEFLLFLHCKTPDEANRAAERLLDAVRGASAPLPQGSPLTLTVTLGLARVGNHEAMAAAVERADAALYEGKRAGRDRYVLAKD